MTGRGSICQSKLLTGHFPVFRLKARAAADGSGCNLQFSTVLSTRLAGFKFAEIRFDRMPADLNMEFSAEAVIIKKRMEPVVPWKIIFGTRNTECNWPAMQMAKFRLKLIGITVKLK